MGTGWWQELKRRNVVRVGLAYAVVGWVVAQIADLLFDTFGAPEWVHKVFVALILLGLPFALIFAWAFELTPEGLKRSEEVDLEQSITKHTGRKVDYVIIAALVAAVAFLGWDKLKRDAAPQTAAEVAASDAAMPTGGGSKAASIAVLPFADMSPERDQEYFADGISEELLNLLARIPGLKVAARTSSFAFKGKEQDVREIAEALEVSKVLEGSIRTAGTRLRITAQLIEADTGFHLWSDTYDRELDDVFAIQDEISAAIVDALKQTLELGDAAPSSARSSNIEAYNHYLEGLHLMRRRGQGPLEQARVAFEKVIALDDQYAPGYAALAQTILLLRRSSSSYGDIPTKEAVALAEPLVTRALALAPGLAEAHVANGFLHHTLENFTAAVAAYDRALAINPNMVQAWLWRGQVMQDLNRHEESLVDLGRAIELDPLAYVPVQNWVVQLADRGRYDEALAAAEQLVRVYDDANSYRGAVATLYTSQGRLDKAHEALLKAQEREPDDFATQRWLFFMYFALGFHERAEALAATPREKTWLLVLDERWAEAAAAAAEWLADTDNDNAREAAAYTHYRMGEPQQALAYLQPMIDRSEGIVGPLFDKTDLVALFVVVLQRELGDNAAADAMLARARQFYEGRLAAGFKGPFLDNLGACILALEGRDDEALALLRKVVATGAFLRELDEEAAYKSLYDNAEFQQLAAENERTKERQREAVLRQLGATTSAPARPVL